MTTTTTTNGAIYKTTTVLIGKTKYTIMVVTGKYNYVNVNKITAIRSLGKDFADFDEARNHYKNEQLKLELLKVETGLI